MSIPKVLWDVLNESERIYLCALMDNSTKSENVEEFTATVKAMAALFKDGPDTKLTLTVSNATEAEIEAVRAALTPEENKHVVLVRT